MPRGLLKLALPLVALIAAWSGSPPVALAQGLPLPEAVQRDIMGRLRARISECWRPPADGRERDSSSVTVRMRLDRAGALIGEPELVPPLQGDRALESAGLRALQAVRLCAPYDDLPAEYYEGGWNEVTLRFAPLADLYPAERAATPAAKEHSGCARRRRDKGC